LEAAYNYVYLAAAADVLGAERMVLESNGSKHPLVIRPEDDSLYVVVVMPMDL
jgi:DNA polymerase III sliding clamp (beta) subunit (PCNA family)